MADIERILWRLDEHMARQDEHMTRQDEHMARQDEHMARQDELMERNKRAFEGLMEVLKTIPPAIADLQGEIRAQTKAIFLMIDRLDGRAA